MTLTVRTIVGCIALGIFFFSLINALIASDAVLEKVNEKLPPNQQIDPFWMPRGKMRAINKLYKSFYPKGTLVRRERICEVLAVAGLALAGWAFRFFDR